MYLGLTTRYIKVITDMGLFCMISDMSNAAVQEGGLGYPNTLDLSKKHRDH